MTNLAYDTVTIASSGTESTAADLANKTLVGFFLPSALTGTTMTFKAFNAPDATYYTMADGAGADISKTVAASKYIPLNPQDYIGVSSLKFVSGSSEAAERTITYAYRSFQ